MSKRPLPTVSLRSMNSGPREVLERLKVSSATSNSYVKLAVVAAAGKSAPRTAVRTSWVTSALARLPVLDAFCSWSAREAAELGAARTATATTAAAHGHARNGRTMLTVALGANPSAHDALECQAPGFAG